MMLQAPPGIKRSVVMSAAMDESEVNKLPFGCYDHPAASSGYPLCLPRNCSSHLMCGACLGHTLCPTPAGLFSRTH